MFYGCLYMKLSLSVFYSFLLIPMVLLVVSIASASDTDSDETEMFINNEIACGNINGKWLPGILKKNKKFNAYKDSITILKIQIKEIGLSDEKIIKLQNKTKKFKLLHKSGIKECKAGPPTKTPVGTPTPEQTPPQIKTPSNNSPGFATPTPKPTQSPIPKGCFNAQGQTTCFGIGEAGLTGNITTGKNIFDNGNGTGTSCMGCHKEGDIRNKTFNQISSALKEVPEMITYRNDFTGSDIAHLAAYLNRFN